VEKTRVVKCRKCLEDITLRWSHKQRYGDVRSGWYYPDHFYRVKKRRVHCSKSGAAVTVGEAKQYDLDVP
jgi:hypothetical protein